MTGDGFVKGQRGAVVSPSCGEVGGVDVECSGAGAVHGAGEVVGGGGDGGVGGWGWDDLKRRSWQRRESDNLEKLRIYPHRNIPVMLQQPLLTFGLKLLTRP